MYLHVKPVGEVGDVEQGDPIALLVEKKVELVHSECVGGVMAVEDGGETVVLTCTKCEVRQDLDRTEASDALRRVLLYDEYAWAGDAGLLPD